MSLTEVQVWPIGLLILRSSRSGVSSSGMTQAAIVDLVGVVSTAAGAGVGALASGGAVICLTLASRELGRPAAAAAARCHHELRQYHRLRRASSFCVPDGRIPISLQ